MYLEKITHAASRNSSSDVFVLTIASNNTKNIIYYLYYSNTII